MKGGLERAALSFLPFSLVGYFPSTISNYSGNIHRYNYVPDHQGSN